MSEDERTLFREAVGKPRASGSQKNEQIAEAGTKKSRGPGRPVEKSGTRGLDGRTAERLRRGQIEPEERLDLHGMTEATAHRTLLGFLRTAHRRGTRLVLVVTGKGASEPAPDAPFDMALVQRARGVLKTMTPRWLSEPEFARLVADIRTAHRKHGGGGALYIYLRKAQR